MQFIQKEFERFWQGLFHNISVILDKIYAVEYLNVKHAKNNYPPLPSKFEMIYRVNSSNL